MIDNLLDFFAKVILKFIVKLPPSPFDFETPLADFESVMGYVNFFIPFYKFKTIYDVWLVTFDVCIGIFFIVKILMARLKG